MTDTTNLGAADSISSETCITCGNPDIARRNDEGAPLCATCAGPQTLDEKLTTVIRRLMNLEQRLTAFTEDTVRVAEKEIRL